MCDRLFMVAKINPTCRLRPKGGWEGGTPQIRGLRQGGINH